MNIYLVDFFYLMRVSESYCKIKQNTQDAKKSHFSILKFCILYFMYLVRVCPNQLRKVTDCRTEFEGLNLQD